MVDGDAGADGDVGFVGGSVGLRGDGVRRLGGGREIEVVAAAGWLVMVVAARF